MNTGLTRIVMGLFLIICAAHSAWAGAMDRDSAAAKLILDTARQIETQLDARVGLAIHDTGTGTRWHYNAHQRFPMTSTFKVLACGALLARSDISATDLSRQVLISRSDIVTYSPVTTGWIGQRISLDTLCATTMRTSDNTAANKVLQALGGPAAITEFLRSIGDDVTRLDRWETELNDAAPGDRRDTTTPAAMSHTLKKLLLGDALSMSAKTKLTQWMVANEVGEPLLRAGIPNNWRIGDRTGAGNHGSRGIVAIIWPPDQAPLIAVIYITQTDASMEQRNEAIATIGKALSCGLISDSCKHPPGQRRQPRW